MKRICAVFDIDDTLYLERDYVLSGFQEVGRWSAKWLELPDFGAQCRRLFESGHRRSIFDVVLRESGVEPTADLVTALVEIYRTHWPSIALAQDAAEALRELAPEVSIAVLSDGPVASQSRKAEALGLTSVAAPIVLTDVFGMGFRKPNPRAFLHIQRSHSASVFAYIADNPMKDFEAPRQLGWKTVRIRRPGGLHNAVENSQAPADYEMSDCSQLPALLAQL